MVIKSIYFFCGWFDFFPQKNIEYKVHTQNNTRYIESSTGFCVT